LPIWTFDKKLANDCKKAKIKVFTSAKEVEEEFL